MVAAEADGLVWRAFLKMDQEVDDAPAIRASVDVISQEDELGFDKRRISPAKLDEPLELVEAPVNIADSIRFSCHRAFPQNLIHCLGPQRLTAS